MAEECRKDPVYIVNLCCGQFASSPPPSVLYIRNIAPVGPAFRKVWRLFF